MPTELNNQLLTQLRGIQMPEPVSWWPLAIGWWILLAITLLLLAIGIKKIVAKKTRNKYRKAALSELQQSLHVWQQDNNTSQYLHKSNAILKRIIRQLEQNTPSSNLNTSGTKWEQTLNQYTQQPISADTLKALSIECYQDKPTSNIEQCHQQIETWIKTHRSVNNA